VRAFGEIHGVGQAKLDRYADAFLDVLKAHAA
jgi:ATP-dependent DNA helicase RecQ